MLSQPINLNGTLDGGFPNLESGLEIQLVARATVQGVAKLARHLIRVCKILCLLCLLYVHFNTK